MPNAPGSALRCSPNSQERFVSSLFFLPFIANHVCHLRIRRLPFLQTALPGIVLRIAAVVCQVVIFFQIFADSQRQLDAALHIEVLPIREIAAVPNAEAPLRIVEIQQRNAAFLRHLPQRADIHMIIFVIRAWIRNQDDLNALRFAEIADALEIFCLAPVNFLARLRPEERWLRVMLHLVAFDEAFPVDTASARPAGKREILRRQ